MTEDEPTTVREMFDRQFNELAIKRAKEYDKRAQSIRKGTDDPFDYSTYRKFAFKARKEVRTWVMEQNN